MARMKIWLSRNLQILKVMKMHRNRIIYREMAVKRPSRNSRKWMKMIAKMVRINDMEQMQEEMKAWHMDWLIQWAQSVKNRSGYRSTHLNTCSSLKKPQIANGSQNKEIKCNKKIGLHWKKSDEKTPIASIKVVWLSRRPTMPKAKTPSLTTWWSTSRRWWQIAMINTGKFQRKRAWVEDKAQTPPTTCAGTVIQMQIRQTGAPFPAQTPSYRIKEGCPKPLCSKLWPTTTSTRTASSKQHTMRRSNPPGKTATPS